MKRSILTLLCAGLILAFISDVRAGEDEEMPELTRGRVVAFYREYAPWVVEELKELKDEEPEEFEEYFHELAEHVEYYLELRRRSPKDAKLLVELLKLERKVDLAIDLVEEKRSKENIAHLRLMLSELFKVETGLAAVELRALEREVKELRAHIEKRKHKQDEMVRDELNEILGDIERGEDLWEDEWEDQEWEEAPLEEDAEEEEVRE